MSRVQAVDHLVITVSDFTASNAFYSAFFDFLGFKVMDEFEGAKGWSNGSTRFWIYAADDEGIKHPYRLGDIGFHHYAFSLNGRKDVDELQTFLIQNHVRVVDPADEYYPDYYAVFFLDPDGLKLEGMHYG